MTYVKLLLNILECPTLIYVTLKSCFLAVVNIMYWKDLIENNIFLCYTYVCIPMWELNVDEPFILFHTTIMTRPKKERDEGIRSEGECDIPETLSYTHNLVSTDSRSILLHFMSFFVLS